MTRTIPPEQSPDMFSGLKAEPNSQAPLAARMRPRNLDEFVGQEHLIGPGRILRKSIEADRLPSMILWGMPGSGKTTLAYIIAGMTKSHFSPVSAVTSGVADLRRVVQEAKQRRTQGQRTILFIDEIHRFNKAQQDAILPFVEDGTVVLIGATTENPSFEVIGPLLSRSRVFTLEPLTDEQMGVIVKRALEDSERGLGNLKVEVEDHAIQHLVAVANGDARVALNALETAAAISPPGEDGKRVITLAVLEDAVQRRALLYDKGGEEHFNLISALHKSVRGSDPDASLYWLGRMLEAGEDPMFIARRLVRMATEDIGLADPQALVVAVAAQQALHLIGMPEADLALAEATVYLATAPKSNSLYSGYAKVRKEIKDTGHQPVPIHFRNPVTPLLRNLGYGKDYKYAHDYPGHFVEQQALPDKLQGKRFYEPSEEGCEKEIKERLDRWWKGKK